MLRPGRDPDVGEATQQAALSPLRGQDSRSDLSLHTHLHPWGTGFPASGPCEKILPSYMEVSLWFLKTRAQPLRLKKGTQSQDGDQFKKLL